MAAIKEELDNAPSLEPYEYKAWDGDARDFVNGILRQYLNPGSSMDSVVSNTSSNTNTTTSSNDDLFPTETAAPAAESTPVAETTTSTSSDSDDLDSFLNDLDI